MLRIKICLFLSLWLLFLFGCTQGPTKDYGGTLRIGIFHKPTEINPLTTDSSISASLLDLIFSRLVYIRGDGEIRPELAKSWEISPDRLTWTFHLRDDVRFHDGTPLDADDLKFTFESMKNIQRGLSHGLTYVKEVRVLDPHSIRIVLSRPDDLLSNAFASIMIAPRHLLEHETDFSEFNRHPIGSGPYRFVKQDEEEIILEANERYFEGKPHLDRIVIKILPSQEANLSHLIAGKIDMVFLLNPEDYGALSGISDIRIYHNWYPLVYLLTFNMKNQLFKDAEVRRALNLAVDKQQIINRVLNGKGTIAAGTFDTRDRDFNRKVSPFPYRPDLAHRILEEKGWRIDAVDQILKKGKKRFEFSALTMEGDDLNIKALWIIQEQLRKIGVKMNVQTVPFDEYVERVMRKKDFEGTFIYLILRPYYNSNFILWHSSQIEKGINFSSYSNPKVDSSLEKARLSPGLEDRRSAWLEFQQALHDDPPGIFLFWRDMPIAINKRFRGIPEHRMESLRDLVDVWVPKDEQVNH